MYILLKRMMPFFVVTGVACSTAYSQSDTARHKVYAEMSLEELLNVKIVSVSKKPESLFDAPLSASVVTRQDIRRAGCTSIMEALRLAPGMIVREQSNGNYDIHLRGMDNVPPNLPFDIAANSTILVMIDDRPIYNYLRGGTFWETLPVDLNDVEKIEVVRGPAAALYGPNAVNGVINIITRKPQQDGLYTVVNSQQGSLHTFINNASVGYRSKKWSMIASGNYQGRQRSQTSYFEYNRNRWMELPDYFLDFVSDSVRNTAALYPDTRLAMEKYAGNVFVHVNPVKDIQLDLSTGLQHSRAQRTSAENELTPFCTTVSDSRYADVRARVKGLAARLSYNEGTQILELSPGNKYDFYTVDAGLEYNYIKNNLSIKPGISYRSAVYDDTRYSDLVNKSGIFNARGKITTISPSLRAEYTLLDDRLRLVAGLAANRFNYPDTVYASYQFAATWKLSKKHLFRAVYSKAPRSSTVFDTYVDQTIALFPSGPQKMTRVALLGNKNLELLIAGMLEIGYRGVIMPGLQADVELFNIHSHNYSVMVNSPAYWEMNGSDTLEILPIITTNLPIHVRQRGVTLSVTWQSEKLEVKPFITLQQTRIKDYAPSIIAPGAFVAPGMSPLTIYSGIGTTATIKSTPAVFGGASANWLVAPGLNMNLSAYYYTDQTHYHTSNLVFNDGIRGVDHIPAKLLLNASLSYQPVKGLHLFCSGKNLLNDNSREFYRADAVPFMLLGGISYEMR